MSRDEPIAVDIAFWATGLVLAGLLFIGAGLNPGHGLSTRIRATGTVIELTWGNGATQVVRDVLDTNDPHLTGVKVWGGSSCWITVNDRVVAFSERPDPRGCVWDRSKT